MKLSDADERFLRDELEKLHAVTMLEYHNSNWLSGDPKRRCEATMETIRQMLRVLGGRRFEDI